jgi:hypothetical protein
VLFFPQSYQTVSHVLAEDLVVVVRAASTAATTCPRSTRRRLSLPDLDEGDARPVVVVACRSPGAPRRSWSGSRTCSPPTRAHRGAPAAHPDRAARPSCGWTTGCA